MKQLINLTSLITDGIYRVISTGTYNNLLAKANYMGSWGLNSYGILKNDTVIYSTNSKHKVNLSIIEFIKTNRGIK